MKHQHIQQTLARALTCAIPTIICAIALALSFWVILATEAKAHQRSFISLFTK